MKRVLLALFLFLTTAQLRALDVPKERWTRIQIGNLTVYSHAADGTTRAVTSNLQRLRETLAHVMGLEIDSPVPMTVFIFRSEQTFAPLRDLVLGRQSKNVGAIFSSSPNGDFIVLRADAPGGIDRLVYHEMTHAVMSFNSPGLPLWYQEGIAEFYSTFQPVGDSVKIGVAPRFHLDHVAEWGVMPLRTVFAVDYHSPEYNEAVRAGDFYTTSWLFVHYLLLGAPQRSGQLSTFLTLLDARKPVDDAFRAAFRTTHEQLEGELRQHIHQSIHVSWRRHCQGNLRSGKESPPRSETGRCSAQPRELVRTSGTAAGGRACDC